MRVATATCLGRQRMAKSSFYWEGLYWDGFDPELVGAIALASANDEEGLEKSLKTMVELIQKSVKERGFKLEEFFVTRMELEPDVRKDVTATTSTASADVKIPNKSSSLAASSGDKVVATVDLNEVKKNDKNESSSSTNNINNNNSSNNQSNDKSSASSTSAQVPPSNAYRPDELVIFRLWHEDVFSGARASGKANPGEKCCDYYFDKSGVFIKYTDWTTTDITMFTSEER